MTNETNSNSDRIKRGLDVAVASVALLIMSPILVVVALIIKFGSPGRLEPPPVDGGGGISTTFPAVGESLLRDRRTSCERGDSISLARSHRALG